MERIIDVLGRTQHRYVVSKGPQHTAFDLADNMIGAEFLPQTSVLPHVDLRPGTAVAADLIERVAATAP